MGGDESGNESRDEAREDEPPIDVEAVENEDTLQVDMTGCLPVTYCPMGAISGLEIAPIADAENLFSHEEHERYSALCDQVEFKGFAFMQVKELDHMYKNWPDTATFSSKHPQFLRGLAVTYFYQSQMTKARELLLKIWESAEDLDVALMLAECACALPSQGTETFGVAYRRLCDFTENGQFFTSKHVERWEVRLKKNGRFMGYILLRLALYTKLTRSDRVSHPKRLTYSCLRKISKALYGFVDEKMLGTSPQLNKIVIYLIEMFKRDIDSRFFLITTPKHTYVEAFHANLLAYLYICCGDHVNGLESLTLGLNILEFKYKFDADQRLVKGDLLMNRGAALFKKEHYGEARMDFYEALQLYKYAAEGRDHSEVRDRSVAFASEACICATALENVDD